MKTAIILLTILVVCAKAAWSQESRERKLVCYYASWSYYRNDLGKFVIEDIDPSICTHLVYAFAILNETTYELQPQNPSLDVGQGNFEKFTALKSQNPQLKTLLSIGGWEDSRSPKYSQLVADPQKVSNFVTKSIELLEHYNFDGLDVDWEYPGAEDKENFGRFVTALSEAFRLKGLILSAAVSPSAKTIDEAYDVAALSQHLDLLNLMAYDFHGGIWEPETTDHHSPLLRRPYQTDDLDADSSVMAWVSRGFPIEKIILGVPAYGRSWTLQTLDNTAPPAPAVGAGLPGPYTNEDGIKAFYEIGLDIRTEGWVVVEDSHQNMGPYAYGGEKQWIGYDDVPMARRKTSYMKEKGLGGIMVWEVSMDDFKNYLGGGIYPFLNAIRTELNNQ